MFEQSILESSRRGRTRRGWATLVSSALQAVALALLILVPVLRPDALPLGLRNITNTLPMPYGAVARPAQSAGTPHPGPRPVITDAGLVFVPPHANPLTTYFGADGPPGASTDNPAAWPVGCPTCPAGVPPGMNSALTPPPLPPHPTPAHPAQVSRGVMEGYLVQQVQPPYPPLAKLAGVQGDVVLQAVISRDGAIEQLHAVSGHPLLLQAALDAVGQWRYRPYRLNGEPVEVETQITVRFLLSGH